VCFQAIIERRPNIAGFEHPKRSNYECFPEGFSLITHALLWVCNIVSSFLSTSGRSVTLGCNRYCRKI